jgi:DNA-binding protein H-NS
MVDKSGDDFESMTDDQLQEVLRNAQQELDRRIAEKRSKAMNHIRLLAAEAGLTVRFGDEAETVSGKKGRGGPSSGLGKVPALYRHPENPGVTWSGRGRKPPWVKEAIAKGREAEIIIPGAGGTVERLRKKSPASA